jgi:hypothetical protein
LQECNNQLSYFAIIAPCNFANIVYNDSTFTNKGETTMNVYAAKNRPVVDYDPDKREEAAALKAEAEKLFEEGWITKQWYESLADLKRTVMQAKSRKYDAMPVFYIAALVALADDTEAEKLHYPAVAETVDMPRADDPQRWNRERITENIEGARHWLETAKTEFDKKCARANLAYFENKLSNYDTFDDGLDDSIIGSLP